MYDSILGSRCLGVYDFFNLVRFFSDVSNLRCANI